MIWTSLYFVLIRLNIAILMFSDNFFLLDDLIFLSFDGFFVLNILLSDFI